VVKRSLAQGGGGRPEKGILPTGSKSRCSGCRGKGGEKKSRIRPQMSTGGNVLTKSELRNARNEGGFYCNKREGSINALETRAKIGGELLVIEDDIREGRASSHSRIEGGGGSLAVRSRLGEGLVGISFCECERVC